MTTQVETTEEQELALGEKLKALRLSRNLDQKTLAERAGLSVRALRNLEAGQGSSVKTLIGVLRALGRQDWLNTIAPVASINPLALTRTATPRQRASGTRSKDSKGSKGSKDSKGSSE